MGLGKDDGMKRSDKQFFKNGHARDIHLLLLDLRSTGMEGAGAGCGNDCSISTCEFLLEVHVLMSNLIFFLSSSLLDPAIRICTYSLPDNNTLRLIAGRGND